MEVTIHWELWQIVEGGLWKWRTSLYGRSVRENWRRGSFTGDPEGYVEKALETGNSLHRGPIGEPGRGLIYQGLWEMDEGGSRIGASLSEGEPGGGGPLLLGTLEDV